MGSRIADCFESLFFSESTIGAPMVEGPDLIVPVRGVYPLEAFPPPHGAGPIAGRLIFLNAASSSRTVTEYLGDSAGPEGFKEPYTVSDTVAGRTEDGREYAFEGVQDHPAAWVDWTVRAGGFALELD